MSDATLDHNYPGVGRLNFLLAHLGIGFAYALCVYYFGPGSAVSTVVSLFVLVAGFILDVMRLRNMGVSQWFALLRLIPFAGGILAICLFSAQTGWIETRRLDRNGIMIAAIFVALVVVMYFQLLSLGMFSLFPV